MTSNEKLNLLTQSIRLTNQAKIFKLEISKLDRMIEILQARRLQLNFRVIDLTSEAHKIQLQVIPPTIIPTKKQITTQKIRTKLENINENTLVEMFGEEEASRLSILGEEAGI